jgi:hypothetical protein
MYLIINGYEFGQWLRVLLWIGLPAMLFLTMLTTWIHYRRGRIAAQLLLLETEGIDEGGAFSLEPDAFRGDERVDEERSIKEGEADYKENLYKGILWMKEKYEQYRDLADERHERLKEQLTRMEKKYEDLLTRVRIANPGLLEMGTTPPALAAAPTLTTAPTLATAPDLAAEPGWTERVGVVEAGEPGAHAFSGETEVVVERAESGGDRMRIQELEAQLARMQERFDEEVARTRYQLEEKQRLVEDMEGQRATDRVKIEELVAKLRNNSQLLMNIYQELDKSLHLSDTPTRE